VRRKSRGSTHTHSGKAPNLSAATLGPHETSFLRRKLVRDVSLAEIGVIFRMRAKLAGLCVRYMRENLSIRPAEALRSSLKKLKAATSKNSEEGFFLADMELPYNLERGTSAAVVPDTRYDDESVHLHSCADLFIPLTASQPVR
jgi:hypothetical protein